MLQTLKFRRLEAVHAPGSSWQQHTIERLAVVVWRCARDEGPEARRR